MTAQKYTGSCLPAMIEEKRWLGWESVGHRASKTRCLSEKKQCKPNSLPNKAMVLQRPTCALCLCRVNSRLIDFGGGKRAVQSQISPRPLPNCSLK